MSHSKLSYRQLDTYIVMQPFRTLSGWPSYIETGQQTPEEMPQHIILLHCAAVIAVFSTVTYI